MSNRSTSSLTTLSGIDALVPQTIASVDIRKLPLGPEEAFVWTRIDGHSNIREICFTTGFAPERVVSAVQRLIDVGAVRPLPGFTQTTPKPAVVPSQSKPDFAQTKVVARPAEASQPAVIQQDALDARPDGAPEAEPKTLSERIERLKAKYAGNHYQVLGVARGADRSTIKDAYFTRVAQVHPDKFFGVELGEHKAALEQLFRRLTSAHDTLTRAKLRADYDATLPPEEVPRGEGAPVTDTCVSLDSAPTTTSPTPTEAQNSLQARLSQQPASSQVRSPTSSQRGPASTDSLNPDSAGPISSGPVSSVPGSQRGTAGVSSRPSVAPISVTLRPRRPPPRPGLPSASMPPPPSVQPRPAPRTSSAAQRPGPGVPAAEALRVASSLLTGTPGVVHITEASNQAENAPNKAAQKANLLAAARDARARSDYAGALKHYMDLINLQPEPSVLREAAQCATSGQQHQKAAEILRKALTVEPSAADLHSWLGSIYASAGMLESAKSEFQRALALNPKDDQSRQWLKRIERGDVHSL